MRKFVAVALLFAQACIAWENFVYPLGHAGTCLEAGTTCLACNALVNCIATEQGLESLVIPCPPDSKCHVEGGVASCFQESEVPECTCSSLGVFPDPYSARHYFICYPEDDDAMTAVEAKCPEGTVFSAGKQDCVEEIAAAPCRHPGVFPTSTCSRDFYYCVYPEGSDGLVQVRFMCSQHEVFHPRLHECTSPESVAECSQTSTSRPEWTTDPWWRTTTSRPEWTTDPWWRTTTSRPEWTTDPWWRTTTSRPEWTTDPWWRTSTSRPEWTTDPWWRTSTSRPEWTTDPWWRTTTSRPEWTTDPWWRTTTSRPEVTTDPWWRTTTSRP
nr:salivary glue protein Sgs-3-like isoform X5 [Penaeus vannamei]